MNAFGLVAIGSSLGGLQALEMVLQGLVEDFSLPIVLIQHRHLDANARLVQLLHKNTPLPISEAEDKELVRAGHVYLAPTDYHLLVEKENQGGHFALSTQEPVHYARPSIDVFFESAALAYREKAVGVLLTGSTADGATGLAKIKSLGGHTVVEDPQTAYSPVMPQAGLAAAPSSVIVSLPKLADYLTNLLKSQERQKAR